MDRAQTEEIFGHLFDAARELDEARAVASAFAAQDESAASLEEFIVKLNSELIGALFDQFPDLMPFEEFPAISSTLTWDHVDLPPSISEKDIDDIVFSVMKPSWRKVAMVVVQAQKLCEQRGLEISHETLAARLQILAESGCIEGAGDLRKWRFSEVRLKG